MKKKMNVGKLQESLILPLWARAKESEKKDPFFLDHMAKELVDSIDYDFSKIEGNQEISENQQLQWVIRAYQFDREVKSFLAEHDDVTIINLGAGLDTGFQRLDDGKMEWVNIELPDVAEIREALIGFSERERTIPKSVFDYSWISDIRKLTKDRNVLILAAGVLFYFDEEQVLDLIRKLSDDIPGAEMVFDTVTAKIWIIATNFSIMSKSGLDQNVRLKWHLRKGENLSKSIKRIEVVDEYSMFTRFEPKGYWNKKIRRDIKIGNMIPVYKLIHIKFI